MNDTLKNIVRFTVFDDDLETCKNNYINATRHRTESNVDKFSGKIEKDADESWERFRKELYVAMKIESNHQPVGIVHGTEKFDFYLNFCDRNYPLSVDSLPIFSPSLYDTKMEIFNNVSHIHFKDYPMEFFSVLMYDHGGVSVSRTFVNPINLMINLAMTNSFDPDSNVLSDRHITYVLSKCMRMEERNVKEKFDEVVKTYRGATKLNKYQL